MGLYKDWTDLLGKQTEATYEDFWKEYSGAETRIYTDILANKLTKFEGKVSELATKYETSNTIFMGFLDGINTSIDPALDLDSITPDSDVVLNIDFEKLFFNMFKAEADYLYSLTEWDDIFDEDKKREIWDSFRRSRTVVKEQKVGRNDPCPCGSGKKYKHCCGK